MKANLFLGLLTILSLSVGASAHAKHRHARRQSSANSSQQQYSSGGVRPGSACSASDRDPIKCKVCAIYGEDRGSRQGMEAVAGVIETRARSGRWSSDVCTIVHGKGQFIGAWHVLPNNPALLAEMTSVAQSARPNGYLGFRSYCKPGRNTRIGGNCFGTADAERYIELDPTMTADEVDAQAAENVQMAQIYGDEDAG